MIFTNPTFAHSSVRFPAVAGLAITRRDSQVGSANLEIMIIMRRTIVVMMMVVSVSDRQDTQVFQASLKMVMNVIDAEN